jgi:hypothetical protein
MSIPLVLYLLIPLSHALIYNNYFLQYRDLYSCVEEDTPVETIRLTTINLTTPPNPTQHITCTGQGVYITQLEEDVKKRVPDFNTSSFLLFGSNHHVRTNQCVKVRYLPDPYTNANEAFAIAQCNSSILTIEYTDKCSERSDYFLYKNTSQENFTCTSSTLKVHKHERSTEGVYLIGVFYFVCIISIFVFFGLFEIYK